MSLRFKYGDLVKPRNCDYEILSLEVQRKTNTKCDDFRRKLKRNNVSMGYRGRTGVLGAAI